MLDYTFNFNKEPTVILNLEGKVTIDNTLNNKIRLEVDYNSFSEEILNKIKIGREELFKLVTNCITYNTDKTKENILLVPYFVDGKRYWYKTLSENNTLNFSVIKNKVEIYKTKELLQTIDLGYSKNIQFSLNDGEYIFKIITYNLDDEEIFRNDILVTMKTNHYSFNSNKVEDIKIHFGEDEGNFDLMLESNSKKLYSFKITDIKSENNNIMEFGYYSANSNEQMIKGKIGSEINLLNDKQIEEIIKYPELEQLIKPEFVFNINELFTTVHSKDDIGVIRFPTIRNKLRDTLSKYYDLKCDVSQSFSVEVDKTEDLLITDKFNKYPLFYKFLVNGSYNKFTLVDQLGDPVDYLIEDIQDDLHIVYFNPKRQHNYYYTLDDNPPILVEYKKSYESFSMIFNGTNIEFNEPFYIGDLMLKGTGDNEVEILYPDYNRKSFKLKSVDKEFRFLEDERIKIDNKVLGIKIAKESQIINMICPMKNNRTNYSFFKKDFRDFVYIAKEVPEISLEDITDNELSKFNLNGNYILLDGIIEEVPNGPLYLEDINKHDIVFTDIEEWLKEYSVSPTTVVKTDIKDKYFLDNIIDSTREVDYED